MLKTLNRIPKYWLFQSIGWGIFILINLFFLITFDRMDPIHMGRLAISVVLGVLISHLMRIGIRRFKLLQLQLNRQLLGFILLTVIVAILSGLMDNLISYLGDTRIGMEKSLGEPKLFLRNALNAFVILFMWNSIYFMYHYIEKSRTQQLDTLKLQALVKELELKTIKSHINPHFIFNALNSIRALIDENPSRAREAVTELSNILRSSMQSEHQETVTLERELSIVRDYLALEHIRFEDRLKVEYDISDGSLEMPVPPMMLQTLVENAIKHGISKNEKGGVVRISANCMVDKCQLIVRNTGRLAAGRSSEGFGLSSTANRLALMFGDEAKFTISNTPDQMVEARVEIPASLN
jgi:two-component sensor histidine kinase